jgi:hypothetical protein
MVLVKHEANLSADVLVKLEPNFFRMACLA